MTDNEGIEQEITKTLACLDKIENIEAGPFFYNRLLAGIENPTEPRERWFWGLFDSQMLRRAFLIVLVIINLVTAVVIFQSSGSVPDVRREHLTAVAEEYSLNWDDYIYEVLE